MPVHVLSFNRLSKAQKRAIWYIHNYDFEPVEISRVPARPETLNALQRIGWLVITDDFVDTYNQHGILYTDYHESVCYLTDAADQAMELYLESVKTTDPILKVVK